MDSLNEEGVGWDADHNDMWCDSGVWFVVVWGSDGWIYVGDIYKSTILGQLIQTMFI